MPYFLIVAVCISLVFSLLMPIFYGRLLKYRIQRNVEKMGGQVLDIQPHQFYPGEFTALDAGRMVHGKEKQIYLVEYVDKNDDKVVRMCHVTLLGGFYWYEPN